ncbi:MAG: SET domain-containing protein-lysine N-methyltransferase [Chitinophagales bacterium]
MISKKINYKITHQFEEVEISSQDLKHLLAILRWEEVPPFKQPGRTAWYELQEDASVSTLPNQALRAAKIKGIGFWNPKPEGKIHSGVLAKLNSEEPTPPTTDVLTSMLTFPHIGFGKDGEYMIAYSKAAPIGGILHERALLEYESAKILMENGVPSTIPFMVISYEGEYEFKGKPMGVVVNLSPEADTVRLSIFQYGQAVHHGQDATADAYFDKICNSLGITGQRHLETTRLQVMNLLARKIGALLHDFSAAGLYRYSSEWSNFEYNFGTKEVFLTDLDSTLKLKDLPVNMRPLQVLRDFGTAAYRLIAKFGFPTILNEYTLDNLLTYDPLAELLTGYFPNAPFDQIEPISQHLWNAFIPHWFLLKKHETDINGDWSRPRRQTYKMDHDLFYILAISQVFPLYLQSDLFKKYPTDLTMEDMLQKAENFLGDRYEYFLYLLNGNKVVHQRKEKGYELNRMDGKGEGVIAKQAYEQGQVIMRGEIIKIFGGNHSHAAQIAENTWALHAGITHKINHACSPNAGFRVNETGGHDIVAIKSIQPNEEIVADYAMRNYQIEHFPSECKCGAADCRVKITGWKDLPSYKKEEYRNWSIPYLFELDKKYRLETV